MIFLLGYIPDRAYYFTVNRTIDLGILAWSPVNFCPPENQTLPCPAPVGAVVPWDGAPAELVAARRRGSTARSPRSGRSSCTSAAATGRRRPTRPSSRSTSGVGNFDNGPTGRSCPRRGRTRPSCSRPADLRRRRHRPRRQADERRSSSCRRTPRPASSVSGRRPRTSKLDLTLPEPRSGAVARPGGRRPVPRRRDGRRDDAGEDASGSRPFDKAGVLQPWQPQADLLPGGDRRDRRDRPATTSGSTAGPPPRGPTQDGPARRVPGRRRGDARRRVHEPRAVRRRRRRDGPARAHGRTPPASRASGALYLIGGSDADGPRSELYWAVPDAVGNIAEWKHLPQSDLPASGLAGSASVVLGPNVVLVGGETPRRRRSQAPRRANTRPAGAVLPGRPRRRDGPGAQDRRRDRPAARLPQRQHVGIVNFVILLVIGWAFAHKEQVRAMRERLMTRREGAVARRRSDQVALAGGPGSPRRTGRPAAARR